MYSATSAKSMVIRLRRVQKVKENLCPVKFDSAINVMVLDMKLEFVRHEDHKQVV
jgi:hypothetical protein